MLRRLNKITAAALLILSTSSALAVTLEDYGVVITGSGLVDTTSGLRWLDTGLTFGTAATVDGLLANGWRIADGTEIDYLFTRGLDNPNGAPDNPLSLVDFLLITDALGLNTNGTTGAWACLFIYSGTDYCQTTSNWAFSPHVLSAESAFPGTGLPGVNLAFSIYLTEVPLYGNFETGICTDCVGRTLLVRNVPLPAGVWLMLSALGMFFIRKR